MPYGPAVKIIAYNDAAICHSVTNILLIINDTPLVWISKRQCTDETFTFGSEMIAA